MPSNVGKQDNRVNSKSNKHVGFALNNNTHSNNNDYNIDASRQRTISHVATSTSNRTKITKNNSHDIMSSTIISKNSNNNSNNNNSNNGSNVNIAPYPRQRAHTAHAQKSRSMLPPPTAGYSKNKNNNKNNSNDSNDKEKKYQILWQWYSVAKSN